MVVWSGGFPGGSVVKNLPANSGATGDAGSIPVLGRSPGKENGNPLQYSCLENPMGRGVSWSSVYRVAKSWIWLKPFSMQACLAWGAWREEQVGCQTPFCFFRLHQSIVCLSGGGGGSLQKSLFVQSSGKLGDTLWLKSDWRSAWNLLWCGCTMTWLASGLLATCQPWMDCSTLNNPAQRHLTQKAFPWWITHTRIIQYIFVFLPAVEEPCKASQVTAQIISRYRTIGRMDSSAQPSGASLTYPGSSRGQAETLGDMLITNSSTQMSSKTMAKHQGGGKKRNEEINQLPSV